MFVDQLDLVVVLVVLDSFVAANSSGLSVAVDLLQLVRETQSVVVRADLVAYTAVHGQENVVWAVIGVQLLLFGSLVFPQRLEFVLDLVLAALCVDQRRDLGWLACHAQKRVHHRFERGPVVGRGWLRHQFVELDLGRLELMFEPSKRVAQINRSLFLVPLESLVDRVLLERLSSGLDGRVVEIVVVLFVHGVQHVLELLQTVLLGLELADLGRGFLGKFLDLGGEIVEDCHDLILLLAVGADLAQLVQFVLELCDLGLQLVEIVLESAAFLEHLVGEFFFLLESLADDLVTLLVLLFPGGVHLGTFRRTKPLWLVGPVAAHVIVANAVVHLEPGDVAGRKPFIGAVELRSHARRGAWLIRAVGAVAVVVVDFVCGNDDLRVAQTPPKPVFVGLVDRLALWRDSSNPMGGGLDTKQNQCYH